MENFLTFAQQVALLKNDKKIIISDCQYAEEILQRIGYFSLIGKYKQLFKIPLSKKYKEGTSFDEIVVLYHFDATLKMLFLKYLLQIERHIGNLIAYYFTELYGIKQSEYLNPHNYNNNKRNVKTISILIKKLYGAINTKDYEYINYYRIHHGNIPLWVTTHILTFGSLSKMFKVLPQTLQSKICKHFAPVNPKELIHITNSELLEQMGFPPNWKNITRYQLLL